VIWGSAKELREAVKRLNHFREDFPADGPFTSVSAFGRNLALFHDHAETDSEGMVEQMVLCAGAGRILNARCNKVHVAEDEQTQADIASWWWRANQYADWRRLN
jgi:hypothetical protein